MMRVDHRGAQLDNHEELDKGGTKNIEVFCVALGIYSPLLTLNFLESV
jgi:hypothetical protein